MLSNIWNWGFILVIIASINLGTVRKKEDPILHTQTNPIAYKDKMEEIKDGVKGAPSPSFKHYEKNEFLVDPSIENEELDTSEDQKGLPDADEVLPENLSDEKSSSSEELSDDNWANDLDEELDQWDETSDENSFKNGSKMDEAEG